MRETFPNVHATNAYGLTESSSVATLISGADALAHLGRSAAMPVVDLRIVDPPARPRR